MPEGEGWLDLGEIDETAALRLLLHHSPRPQVVLAEIEIDAERSVVRPREGLRRLLSELQGYPIAIVTAAPHLRDLSVSELLARIEERGSSVFEDPAIRDPIERTRLRSLAITLGLSERKLIDERGAEALSMWGVLSLFPSGLTRAMLRAIAPEHAEGRLAKLRDYSLVQFDDADDRYYLLAPIRRFAQRHLDASVREGVIERTAAAFPGAVRALYEDWPKVGAGVTALLLVKDEANFIEAIDFCRDVASDDTASPRPSLSIAGHLIERSRPGDL